MCVSWCALKYALFWKCIVGRVSLLDDDGCPDFTSLHHKPCAVHGGIRLPLLLSPIGLCLFVCSRSEVDQ